MLWFVRGTRGAWRANIGCRAWQLGLRPSGRGGRQVAGSAAEHMDRMLDESDEDIAAGGEPARVTQDDRYVAVQVERGPDGVGGEAPRCVEAVHGHDERRALSLEVVHGREAV